MHLNNFVWWVIIGLNFIGYFIFRFGIISRGRLKELIQFLGGILLALSFILMFFFFQLLSTIILILVFWFLTPIVEIIIKKFERKVFGQYLQYEKQFTKKLNLSVEELKKYNNVSTENMLGETLPDIKKEFTQDEIKKGINELSGKEYIVGTRRKRTELDDILDKYILEQNYKTHNETRTPEKDKAILEKSYLMEQP